MSEGYYGFVYITTNHANGKKYIGQRKYDRRGYWKTYLGSGTSIKNAIEKYGKTNFSKEIIEECDTKELLNEREKYWIAYYDAYNSREFYNMTSGGDGGDTYSNHSDEEKNIIKNNRSIATKGKINLGSTNGMAKSVICLNNMKIFETLADAGKYANVKPEGISMAIRQKHNAGRDPVTKEKLRWDWYYSNVEYKFEPFERTYKTGFLPYNVKQVKCIELDMVFPSIHEAAKYINRSSSSLSEILRKGNNGKCAGMHWQYV